MTPKMGSLQIELANSIPKSLYDRVEQKWQFSLNTKRQIRETTLASVMPELDKATITKAIKKYIGRFSPKYNLFSILQKDIEDVVQKPT